MDFSTGSMLAGLVVGTIGFSLFVYGKKQARVPHLVVGASLVAEPWIAPEPVWQLTIAGALICGLWLAVRAGH